MATKSRTIKALCIALIAFLCAATLGFTAVSILKANADTELIVPQEYAFKSEYDYGDTLVVPSPSDVKIKAGATTSAAASVTLRFPDGAVKSEGSYTLEKTGNYALTYYNVSGISVTHNFTVYKNYYQFDDTVSAAYVEDLVGVSGKTGIALTLKDGASFTFNKYIDLNDYAGQPLEVCKIFPMFRPDENSDPDVSTVSVKVVDCYDATKFVEFYIWCGGAGQGAYYMGAGASTQVLTGLEQNQNRPWEMTEEYDGQFYKIHRPSRYQSKTAWGRYVSSHDNVDIVSYDGIVLIWDLSNHQMKARNGGVSYLLTDIDSTEIYGVNALDFDSFFTTGEVYLNVEAYNYATTEFTLGLEEIFGMRGDDVKNGRMIDDKAPEVFVDVETTTESMIYLQRGKTVTLPKIARVVDLNYYGNSRVAVYRNYGKSGQVSCKVLGGTFTPELLGSYTAVYTATDSYGNEGKFLLEMAVLDEPNMVYEKVAVKKLVAAKSNLLPYIPASGMNNEVAVEVFVTTPSGNVEKIEHNGVDGYEYVPKTAGNYTITYRFTDNVYTEEYTYEAACVDENSAVFIHPFALPAYFMKGASYTIPPVVAYTAGDGDFKENQASVSVSVDGGAYRTLSESEMRAYVVSANQTLQFKASYGSSYTETEPYRVIDVGYGKTTTQKTYVNYLQGNYTNAAIGDSGMQYDFTGDASLQLINRISSANWKLLFAVQAAAIDTIVLTMRDAQDPYRTYHTYTFVKEGSSTVVFTARQYADGKLVSERGVFTKYKALTGEFSLSYSSLGLSVGDVLLEGVKTFEKDDALLEISVSGATRGCTLIVSQINNQTFSSTVRESKPQMAYKESNGVQEVGVLYEISPCYASAVLGSVLGRDVLLTVLAPNGEVATSVDGIALEAVTADRAYTLKLTQVGQYRVSYSASCIGATRTNGLDILSDSDYYIVNVSEGIPPTIRFKDGSDTATTVHVKVGSTHKIKEFTVSDNLTASENIKVYTMILDKQFHLEENGYNVDSYVFKNVGEFIVYVVAYDELGNSSALYYNVVVS